MVLLIRFLRLILLFILIYILYKILWKGDWFPSLSSKKSKRRGSDPHTNVEEMKKDPICGTYLPKRLAVKYTKGNETLYFCSEECKKQFLALQDK
jgi:uncharacterized protein